MSDSVEVWRARIGIFVGSRRIRVKYSNTTKTDKFIIMLAILSVLSTFVLTPTHGLLVSFPKPSLIEKESEQLFNILVGASSAYVILLSIKKPRQKSALKSYEKQKQKILVLSLVVGAGLLKILLLRAGIEPNPGPSSALLRSTDVNTFQWSCRQYFWFQNLFTQVFCRAYFSVTVRTKLFLVTMEYLEMTSDFISSIPQHYSNSLAQFKSLPLSRTEPEPSGFNYFGLTLSKVKTLTLKYTGWCSNCNAAMPQVFRVVFTLVMLLLCGATLKTLLLQSGIEPNPGPFPCRLCSVVPETIASSIRHQQYHAKNKTFIYYCPAQECVFRTASMYSMNFHVSSMHREERHVDPAVTEKISCTCKIDGNACEFITTSFWELVQHFCNHIDNGIKVQCPVRDCTKDTYFGTSKYFRTHLSQHHSNWKAEGCPKEEFKIFVEECGSSSHNDFLLNDASSCFDINAHSEDNGDEHNGDANSDLMDDKLILDSIAKFYLHMYAVNLLPETVIQEICDSLIFLTEVVHSRIKLVLKSELHSLDIPEQKINLMCFKILQSDLLYSSHHKNSMLGTTFVSHFLRMKYFEKHLGYMPPKQINLEEHNPNSQKIMQYTSPVRTLSKVLEDPSVQQEVDASFTKEKNVSNEIKNFTDGSLYKSEGHPPREIHLFVYQDSFNPVMNALGSAKNKFKALVFYFTIGNFQAHIRARIVTKHLILMVREKVFKAVGAEKCLEEMLKDLKNLEINGIFYKGEIVKVVVEFMIGDSLGQHLVGGFIECFSAKFMCRFCDIQKETFLADPSTTNPQRSVRDYNRCVLRARATGKCIKGIKASCELNCLKYFHATSHLVPCLGHDLFEGGISEDFAGVIALFVSKNKWFTYNLLNKRINTFKCLGIDSTNQPANVPKKGKKLGGHAVQNWLLIRLFYFIIGDLIQDFEDPGWQLYLKMKELCEYFCAPSFLPSVVPYLKDVLIPEYFDLRQSVLDQEKYNLKPKHHYMVHYSELMLRYGPLIHLWTMPFEQKHKFFKQLMRNTQNFINPEYSCAVRQQLNFCYITSGTLFDPQGFTESKPKPLCSKSFSGELAHFISNLNLSGCHESLRVCLDGITYKKDDVILLSHCGSKINIGVVKVLLSKEDLLRFIIEERSALYDPQKGIYHINQDSLGKFSIVSPKDFKYPVPQPIYYYGGKSCFSLKFKLVQIPLDSLSL